MAGRGPAGSGGSVLELPPAKVCTSHRLPGHCCSSTPLLPSAARTGAFCTLSVLSCGLAASLGLGCSSCAGTLRIASTVLPGTCEGKLRCLAVFLFA